MSEPTISYSICSWWEAWYWVNTLKGKLLTGHDYDWIYQGKKKRTKGSVLCWPPIAGLVWDPPLSVSSSSSKIPLRKAHFFNLYVAKWTVETLPIKDLSERFTGVIYKDLNKCTLLWLSKRGLQYAELPKFTSPLKVPTSGSQRMKSWSLNIWQQSYFYERR